VVLVYWKVVTECHEACEEQRRAAAELVAAKSRLYLVLGAVD
jgi:hypothetical protein